MLDFFFSQIYASPENNDIIFYLVKFSIYYRFLLYLMNGLRYTDFMAQMMACACSLLHNCIKMDI